MALNVLVVDDSSVARAMIVRTLRLCGLPLGEIVEAANGSEGLAALESRWIDVVLVDINMPVMNGEEMIQRIRSSDAWRDLPIVVVSTEGSQTRIARIEEQGAKFIHKPFAPEIVRDLLQGLTGMADQQEAVTQ